MSTVAQLYGERNPYKISFPDTTSVKFKNFVNNKRAPFIIYADFECFLKIDIRCSSNSTKYQQHAAYSAGYYYSCDFDTESSYYSSYKDEKYAEWFTNELLTMSHKINAKYENSVPMKPLSPSQIMDFRTSRNCWINH